MNTLTTRRPLNILRVLDRLGKEEDFLSSLTDDMFHFHGFSPLSNINNPDFSPPLDFVDKEDKYTVNLEIPGIEKDQIEVEIDDDILIIKGEKKNEQEQTKNEVYVREISYGSFRREIRLPTDCDKSKIEANHRNGMLCLDLPKIKLKDKEKKKITIKT